VTVRTSGSHHSGSESVPSWSSTGSYTSPSLHRSSRCANASTLCTGAFDCGWSTVVG